METRQAERAAHRVVLELQNRIGMLCIHGAILLMIGVMMVLTGAPAPVEGWYGPFARLLLGGFAALGGLTLLVGTARGDDSWWGWATMLGGTIMAGLWHLSMTTVYLYAAATERMEVLGIGDSLGAAVTSRAYIPLVYLGYVLLVMTHCSTLARLGPPPRP